MISLIAILVHCLSWMRQRVSRMLQAPENGDSSRARSTGKSNSPEARIKWREVVQVFYPDALTRTYCVPPIYFLRVPYARSNVADQPVLVLQPFSSEPPPQCIPPTSQPSGRDRPPSAKRSQPPGPPSLGVPGATSAEQNTPEESRLPRVMWPQQTKPRAQLPKVRDFHVQADLSQQHLLCNLKELGDQLIGQPQAGPDSSGDTKTEVMFIISELNFKDYLNKPLYNKDTRGLPKPATFSAKDQKNYKQGDFDILIITRYSGILVGEIKSVGMSKGSRSDADLVKKVREAVEQVDKSETMVKHLIGDIAPELPVRKSIFLPYVSRERLRSVFSSDRQLEQVVCTSLGVDSPEDAIQMCVCSEQVSDPATYWDITPETFAELTVWWEHRMACPEDDFQMTDDLYLDIVARFVGPATSVSIHCTVPPRVEVRTEGEAVAELGRRLALLVLTQQQLDLMNRSPPRVCLTGPPGTGKTIVLVLQGLRWLLEGHDVQVVSTLPASMAPSMMIQHQLHMTLDTCPSTSGPHGELQLRLFNIVFSESAVDKAVDKLVSAAREGTLHVIMDEAEFVNDTSGPRLERLVRQLSDRVPNLHLWIAGVWYEVPPELHLQAEPLTTPLRSAPVILREVQPGLDKANNGIHSYSVSGIPAPADGLKVVRLVHSGSDHAASAWPVDCVQSGKDIAAQLRRLGVRPHGNDATANPHPLSYRDVFVLTRSRRELQDEVVDEAGKVTSEACGVVRGMREENVPVRVLGWNEWGRRGQDWTVQLAHTVMVRTDEVTVADWGVVRGLERRVVVWLPGRDKGDEVQTDEAVDAQDRLFGVSRCTTQLLVVDVPGPGDSHG